MKYLFLFLVLVLMSCRNEIPQKIDALPSNPLTKTFIDPRNGYSEAVVVQNGNVKTLYISGQVGEGEDFEAQFRDALNNLFKTLEASGATFNDVVKYNTYIVDYKQEYLDVFRKVRKELLGDTDMPASTLVGVQALGLPEWGVEIEAIAIVRSTD